MDAPIWTLISGIAQAALYPILAAVSVWVVFRVESARKRDELKQRSKDAMAALEVMRKNGEAAAAAVQQMFKDLPGDQKAALALSWSNSLNTVAGISAPTNVIPSPIATTTPAGVPITPQTILNEASVLNIKNAAQPVAGTTVTTTTVTPSDSSTMDETLPPTMGPHAPTA